MADNAVRIGVIGGSGLYKMPQLTDVREVQIDTPFGPPSDSIMIGVIEGVEVAFIPRHGRGHLILPGKVPYRANIFALKLLGIERIIAVSACGSLREDYEPGHIVVPNQLFDFTKDNRGRTFFDEELVAHVSVADPFCADTNQYIVDQVRTAGGVVHDGGGFITIEGPRFSTKAESNLFRQWGLSIIGMTTSPEAYLAREAEMCYSVMAHVTDYDVWHESEEPVTVEMVVRTINENVELAQNTLVSLVPQLASVERNCDCGHALETALISDRRKVPVDLLKKLDPLVGKYFK